ncbi:glycosyltransferase, partial [Flavobacteriaceae bacterium AH-315-B10]|nr:glycosyltransferase [Flavobacteriaceae bacterium AH-315-B10]
GTPCVTTSIGAEGMYGNLEPNGFIEDNPQQFADNAVELFTNEALWKEKQENGFKIINQRFNKKKFQNKFLETLEETTQQLHKKRLNNFTGQMLQHHTLQSTKYLSKWIEEKNKTN